MSLLKNVSMFETFLNLFPLSGNKTPYNHMKSLGWIDIFFLYGIQIRAIWIMICRISIFISPTFSPCISFMYLFRVPFLSDFLKITRFSKNYRVCISFGSFWQCELTHLMNLFFGLWEGWINNCNFNWNKKAKMELSKGMKDRSLLTYNKWLILYDS